MQKVDAKDIAWLLRWKECSKTLKIKDVKETILVILKCVKSI
ncbi:MAG: hypothetical protein PPFGHCPK_01435 (plasmid) [Spiroplasma endosymbiont of Drosophila atripex]|nr:MAG: hypothetical protein PPFGHCPK_01435 [Spiroplasma endosymbiont of Drosophila atripex]